MKKVFMTLAAVLMGVTAMNAQLVIGGSLDLGGNAPVKTKDATMGVTEMTNGYFSMNVAPKIGYVLSNGKVELGAALSIGGSQITKYQVLYSDVNDDYEVSGGKGYKDRTSGKFNFFVIPYARFRVFDTKGFGLWFEGAAKLGTQINTYDKLYAWKGYNQYGIEIEQTKEEVDKFAEDQKKVKCGNFTGALSVYPVLTYDINEHWRVETYLNFLGFYVSGEVNTTTDKAGDETIKTTENTCNYGLNIKSGNVINTAFTIGAVYKF